MSKQIAHIRAVAQRARDLFLALEAEGFDKAEILAGFVIAAQAKPAADALEEHQGAKRILERVVAVTQEGMALLAEVKAAAAPKTK